CREALEAALGAGLLTPAAADLAALARAPEEAVPGLDALRESEWRGVGRGGGGLGGGGGGRRGGGAGAGGRGPAPPPAGAGGRGRGAAPAGERGGLRDAPDGAGANGAGHPGPLPPPPEAAACLSRGLEHLQRGEHERAAAEFSAALRHDPALAPAYAHRGEA